ncbi:MAG TPA: sigma factor, partial [Pyrinomonadaceae bacterium]|nr:sigma factor [Pyrinomonadaceae bacterium]
MSITNAATFPLFQKTKREKAVVAPAPPKDHALAQSAAAGDIAAFEQLYERHNRRVYSLCLRMTSNTAEAEDLAQ